ncbi:toxin-antitoxin system HicB family antitoxin [Actinomadura rupiterrae]|uniref:toxin-antitoxin system HicB family antitoxin n=1 Tax=Actinomadura rupiterrae TaxID=559627 RepID=UPI0020A5A1B1|nr:toxin-antitoxin system HicB family antitoxin [Actinomadura rupiterrae]MCP2343109.1 hypothetical protein [Actinomadura rupiterrae]
MDLTPYVERLRRDLAVAAEAGGPEARALAERLTAPLDSTARLVLLEALAGAAGEITTDLAPGSVEVRLRGRDPDFVVTPPPPEEPAGDAAPAPSAMPAEGPPSAIAAEPPAEPGADTGAGAETDEGGTARITLRVPEHLKPRIEAAAGNAGLSVNAWLVRAVAAALEPQRGTDRDTRRTTRADESPAGRPSAGKPTFGAHVRGWVR